MKKSWDIKTCTCSLRAVEDGVACDDGLACTGPGACRQGRCESDSSAEPAQPDGGWAQEGTPLLAPTQPGWKWTPVHIAQGCKACDGARAYVHFVRGGVSNDLPSSLAVAQDGSMVTVDVLARLRAYDSTLEPDWDLDASLLPGLCVSRRIQFGPSGDLFTAGWFEKVPLPGKDSSWAARYSSEGETRWYRAVSQDCAGTDILPTADGGATLVESCGGQELSDLHLAVRRLSAAGEVEWTAEIPNAFPLARAGFRLSLGPNDDVIVSYLLRDSKLNPMTGKAETRLGALAARIGSDSKVVWETRLSPVGFASEAARITDVGGGLWVVAGTEYPDFGFRPQYPVKLWFLDESGIIANRVAIDARDGDYFLVNSVARSTDGGILVAGPLTRYTGTMEPLYQLDFQFWDTDGYLMKLDRRGNFEWMRLYGGPDYDNIFDIGPIENGTITAVGFLGGDLPQKVENWILRTDFWGRTCGMRLGVCADKTWQDCEDNNPCTINWCDPDAGCTAPPLPDGSPCGDGLTCQGAVCK